MWLFHACRSFQEWPAGLHTARNDARMRNRASAFMSSVYRCRRDFAWNSAFSARLPCQGDASSSNQRDRSPPRIGSGRTSNNSRAHRVPAEHGVPPYMQILTRCSRMRVASLHIFVSVYWMLTRTIVLDFASELHLSMQARCSECWAISRRA